MKILRKLILSSLGLLLYSRPVDSVLAKPCSDHVPILTELAFGDFAQSLIVQRQQIIAALALPKMALDCEIFFKLQNFVSKKPNKWRQTKQQFLAIFLELAQLGLVNMTQKFAELAKLGDDVRLISPDKLRLIYIKILKSLGQNHPNILVIKKLREFSDPIEGQSILSLFEYLGFRLRIAHNFLD